MRASGGAENQTKSQHRALRSGPPFARARDGRGRGHVLRARRGACLRTVARACCLSECLAHHVCVYMIAFVSAGRRSHAATTLVACALCASLAAHKAHTRDDTQEASIRITSRCTPRMTWWNRGCAPRPPPPRPPPAQRGASRPPRPCAGAQTATASGHRCSLLPPPPRGRCALAPAPRNPIQRRARVRAGAPPTHRLAKRRSLRREPSVGPVLLSLRGRGGSCCCRARGCRFCWPRL